MIKESKDIDPKCSLNLNLRMLILGAIATSIDALAVGVMLSFGDANIYEACLIIGAVCFILCVAASFVGRVLGDMLESKAMILGGVILIALGVKILAEHLGVLQLLGL
ncbi:manganese efflux pump [Campylobacter iguaniorum]|uniref:manganese efflux pump n=1 Tax=Campylobacter iguaniorum TaxID=1244531 RepID=UPI0030019153